MGGLSKKELIKIQQQMKVTPDRGPTWVGIRPTTMQDKSKYSKTSRQVNKQKCREAERGNNENS